MGQLLLGKWEIHPKLYEVTPFDRDPLRHKGLVPPNTETARKIFLSSYVVPDIPEGWKGARSANTGEPPILHKLYIESRGEALTWQGSGVETGFIDTQGKVIQEGPGFAKEDASTIVTRSPGILWSKYVNYRGDFLEFREDGSYLKSIEVGRWKIEGSLIRFYPKGNDDSRWDGELKNDTLLATGRFGGGFVFISDKRGAIVPDRVSRASTIITPAPPSGREEVEKSAQDTRHKTASRVEQSARQTKRVPRTIAEDDFEGGTLQGGRGWADLQWSGKGYVAVKPSSKAKQGSYAAVVRGTREGSYIMRSVDLSSAVKPRLQFWARIERFGQYPPFLMPDQEDYARLEVSPDKQKWYGVATWVAKEALPSDQPYALTDVDFSSYVGERRLWIRLSVFYKSMQVLGDYPTRYIDEFKVLETNPIVGD